MNGTGALEPQFFVWLEDPLLGVAIAIAALLGTLFTVFSSIGGVLPGTEGKTKLDAEQARLDAYYARFDEVVKGGDVAHVGTLGDQIDRLRDDIRAERRSQFALGAFLYVLLGTAVALALATNWLQAVVISAGWTAYVGSFGLKSDYAARKATKDQAIETLEDKVPAGDLTVDEGIRVRMATAL
jgi:hypothetical protein